MSVDRRPFSAQIARDLRRRILFGDLKKGTHLAQEAICEEYSTSRGPVRDALRDLQFQGFLVDEGNRRPVVAPLSGSDLTDVFAVHAFIHGLCAARAATRMSAEEIDSLEALTTRMIEAESSRDFSAMADVNWKFHREISLGARAPRLLIAARPLAIYLPRDFLARLPEQAYESNPEHLDMVRAIRERDSERASTLAESHVLRTGEVFIGYLRDEGILA